MGRAGPSRLRVRLATWRWGKGTIRGLLYLRRLLGLLARSLQILGVGPGRSNVALASCRLGRALLLMLL